MAKGNGLFGNWKGTIGNVVGFITRSASGELEQGIRSKATQTTNVKSFAQAGVRLRMQPIQNCYRALSGIIDRGYEGIKYGPASYQHFLKLAQDNFGGPYLTKGDKRLVPGPFPITRGTLIPITVSEFVEEDTQERTPAGFVTDLFTRTNLSYDSTAWGVIWSALKQLNTDIKDGDQFTFVQCNRFGNEFIWHTYSRVVDKDDSQEPSQESPWIRLSTQNTDSGKCLAILITPAADETPVAFGVIQSRNGQKKRQIGDLDLTIKDGNTKNYNLRSSCNIYVRPELKAEFMTAVAYQRSVSSYMGESLSEMDWPTIQIASQMYRATVLVPAPDDYTIPSAYAGNNVLGFITPTGGFGYFYKRQIDDDGLYLINANQEIITTSSGSEIVQVKIDPLVQAPLLQWVYGMYETL